MNDKERANLLRWDGGREGFYEVYFLKFNDQASRTAGWLRYTLTSPRPGAGAGCAELWGIFFDGADPHRHFALKKRFALDALRWDSSRFRFELPDAHLAQNDCAGRLVDSARGHELSWELEFDSASEALFYLPHAKLYETALPKTKLVSPHVDARFNGRLVADGRTLELRDAPGQQMHMWGTEHGRRWVWGHCADFAEDPEAVWEGLDAQVGLGPFASPHLKVFFLKFDGRWYRFNRLRQWLINRSNWELGRWNFEARGDGIRLTGSVECDLRDLLGITYRDPDGSPLWCSNTKLAGIRLQVSDEGGKTLGRLTSRASCALEFVDRRIAPEVPIWI